MRSKNVNRRTGAFSTHSRVKFVATSVVAESTTGDSATTVIVSDCELTFICTSSFGRGAEGDDDAGLRAGREARELGRDVVGRQAARFGNR